jgi:hypothetical protein
MKLYKLLILILVYCETIWTCKILITTNKSSYTITKEENKDTLNTSKIKNSDEELEDKKEDKLKIDFYTAYVKLVKDKYKIFTSKKDMQEGYNSDTDEPLY